MTTPPPTKLGRVYCTRCLPPPLTPDTGKTPPLQPPFKINQQKNELLSRPAAPRRAAPHRAAAHRQAPPPQCRVAASSRAWPAAFAPRRLFCRNGGPAETVARADGDDVQVLCPATRPSGRDWERGGV